MERLEREAPFLSRMSLENRLAEIAEEIADQARWHLDPVQIMDWFYDYYGDEIDNLVAMGEKYYEAYNEALQELVDEIISELELRWHIREEEWERTIGEEVEKYREIEEMLREDEEEWEELERKSHRR